MSTKSSSRVSLFKAILVISLTIILCGIVFLAGFIWYNYMDISGLELYAGDEKICEIIPISGTPGLYTPTYILTENKNCYLVGHFPETIYEDKDRKYLNAMGYVCDSLGINSTPILIMEGIIDVIPIGSYSALLVHENGSLYDSFITDTKKIFDNGIDGDVIVSENNEKRDFLVVDSQNVLWYLDTNLGAKPIFQGVSSVKECQGSIYVLTTSHVFGEIVEVEGDYVLNMLMEEVLAFDIYKYPKNSALGDDKDKVEPLINVLNKNGELYVKGTYISNDLFNVVNTSCQKMLFDEWEILSENVKAFSLNNHGTIVINNLGETIYYGFDTNSTAEEQQFCVTKIGIAEAINVVSVNNLAVIKTKYGFCLYGSSLASVFVIEKGHSIPYGEPIIIEQP